MRTLGPRFSMTVAALAVAVATTAPAATITVNTAADDTTAGDGGCTLREAIANVNAAIDTTGGDCSAGTGAGDMVTFNLAPRARITLRLGELVVAQNSTIVGPSPGSLRIRGTRANRVFNISSGVVTVISDLTIEQGSSDRGPGGGIRNDGTLTLIGCTLNGNRARYSAGGGIYNTGTLTLTACTLKGNQADLGGGIVNENGHALTVIDSTFTRNRSRCGGAIVNEGSITPATAILTNCTLTGNQSPQCGGAITNSGTVSLTNCTLAGNRGNAGGAVQNLGTVTLTNCTLQSNKAVPGTSGGLGGGGIWHSNFNLGTATLINTIVAGSGASGNCGGDPITSGGHNLSSDGSCSRAAARISLDTDPRLTRLTNNGGPTATMAPCGSPGTCGAGSPAIDAGDDAVTGPPLDLSTDQRGLSRLSGAHVDIGAYEAQQ